MSNPLPNNRVREFTEMPGDSFYFEPGDVATHREETGIVASIDAMTRQLRLEGWPQTRFVSWEKCRLKLSRDEAAAESQAKAERDAATTTTAETTDDEAKAAKGKTAKAAKAAEGK